MSLYSVLRTSVSGLNAQSSKLGTISDNIANAGTVGYKRAATEFSTLVINGGSTNYVPGAVETDIRYAISEQGALSFTSSSTDLAIRGQGFFIVSDLSGNPTLTRSGNFQVDGDTGFLVNASGYRLMGYDINGGTPALQLNGFGGLTEINAKALNMDASPTTAAQFIVNLPAGADVGDVFSSSVVVFTDIGDSDELQFDFTATGGPPITGYDLTVTPSTTGIPTTFPLTFDADGNLTTPQPLTIPAASLGGNAASISLDLTGTTFLAADYTPLEVETNGNAPSVVEDLRVAPDGTVSAIYRNGAKIPFYRIPLATVTSPDRLLPATGNTYELTLESGDILQIWPTEGAAGSIVAKAVEQSNVDLGTELTELVIAQRNYQANAQSFRTGRELLEVLNNLGR